MKTRSTVALVSCVAISAAAITFTAGAGTRADEPAAKAIAKPAAAKASAAASGETFAIDAVHSSIAYKISHLGITNFYGRFNKCEGSFTFDPANPSSATFSVTIDADSIDSNNSQRDGHLKSPDFFNTKQFPTITFKSKSVEKSGDAFTITGDMTLLGVTKPVTAKFTWGGEATGEKFGHRAGCEASFTFNRSDFGMKYGIENKALGDEVAVTVALEGVAK
jgi:polyisoprenoid-binding protein YceI